MRLTWRRADGAVCPRVEKGTDIRYIAGEFTQKVYDKLADYEDAEEQGLLVRLPCKVGDAIFYLNPFGEIENGRITMIQQKANGTWKFRVTTDFSHDVTTDAFGKTIFLTRAEAEAALKGDGEDV